MKSISCALMLTMLSGCTSMQNLWGGSKSATPVTVAAKPVGSSRPAVRADEVTGDNARQVAAKLEDELHQDTGVRQAVYTPNSSASTTCSK